MTPPKASRRDCASAARWAVWLKGGNFLKTVQESHRSLSMVPTPAEPHLDSLVSNSNVIAPPRPAFGRESPPRTGSRVGEGYPFGELNPLMQLRATSSPRHRKLQGLLWASAENKEVFRGLWPRRCVAPLHIGRGAVDSSGS